MSLDAKGQRIVGECRNLIANTLPKLIAELFDQLDDALYELADKSSNNALQTSYFDALRVLRKERVRVDKEFTRQVVAAFDGFWLTGRVETVRRSLDELSQESEMELLDNDDLEDSLAVTNMISKSENRYSQEISVLGQRFSYLLTGGRQEVGSGEEKIPLEPAVICNAFQSAMLDVPVELPVKLVVYKHFEKHVIPFLGRLYDEISLILSKSGISPKLTQKTRRNPIAPSMRLGRDKSSLGVGDSMLSNESVSVGPDSNHSIDAVQDEIFASLQQLLNLRRTATGDSMLVSSILASGIPGAPMSTVDTGELLGALSALQQSNVLVLPQARGQLVNPKYLRTRLAEDLHLQKGGEAGRTLGDAENDTIDVVSMLFEFILEDSTLPDAMKALLSRLQIPMLKVAIIDKTFFNTKGHPARRLLNNMAQAAIGWNDNGERDTDSLYHKVESIIKRVTNEFHDDSSIFAQLDQEFITWWEQEQRGAEVAEQRTNQVTRGKEQLRNAKKVVVAELNRRLQKMDGVPEAVMEILEDGWKDVLLLNYLRQGPDSEEWKTSLVIVDHLLWSILPKTEYQDRQELLRGIPELLRSLRERLNSISFDQHKMARLFKELQNCHIACLRGGDFQNMKGPGIANVKFKQISFPDSQLVSSGSTYLVDEAGDQETQQPDKYTRQAETLEVGSWLEIIDDNARSRVKLSWKSNVTDAYIFVNRKGMKAMELTRQGLAKRFREGSAKLVDLPKAPIMDRALNAMLTALKNTAEIQSHT